VFTFQNFLLVSAVLFTLGALLVLFLWQDLWGDYNVLLMLTAVTFGVVGFTSLDHEQDN
jgi:NADH:ubiquinone oxidoreductase subunit K